MTKAEYQFHSNRRIFTNGAFVVPIEIKKENGETLFMWVVDNFEDDSFEDGLTVDPAETAPTLDELFKDDEDEEDDK